MKVLVVIDMQNDFIDGALGTKEAILILPNVIKKIQEFEGSVFFTRDTHEENYLESQEGINLPVKHCVRNTKGWELHPEIERLRQETPIDKPTFGSADLGEMLRNIALSDGQPPIESITLVGLCTDICVISNALLLKAFLPETSIMVDASCCAGITDESHKRALESMRTCQIQIINEVLVN